MGIRCAMAVITAAIMLVAIAGPAQAEFVWNPGHLYGNNAADTAADADGGGADGDLIGNRAGGRIPGTRPDDAIDSFPDIPLTVLPGANPDDWLSLVEGFGDNLPLGVALDIIVPESWVVEYDERVDLETRVSWAGGRPWVAVTRDVTAVNGYAIEIGDRRIRIIDYVAALRAGEIVAMR